MQTHSLVSSSNLQTFSMPPRPYALLLHGLTSHSKVRGWERLADSLYEGGFEVRAMDLRGHGQSASGRPSADLQSTHLAKMDVFAFVDANLGENASPFILVGHSLAAALFVSITPELQERYGSRLRAICVSALPYRFSSKLGLTPDMSVSQIHDHLCHRFSDAPDPVDPLCLPFRKIPLNSTRVLVDLMSVITSNLLQRIDTPMFLIHDDSDECFEDVAIIQLILKHVNAEVCVFRTRGKGHGAFCSTPRWAKMIAMLASDEKYLKT